jgi:hypothetical protein
MSSFTKLLCYGLMIARSTVIALPQSLQTSATVTGSEIQEWTGTIIANKPEYTLHGTVDGIYRQIMSIKDASGANTIHDNDILNEQMPEGEEEATALESPHIRIVASKKPKPRVWQKNSDTLYCNVMATGDVRDLNNQRNYLAHHKGQCGAPANSCRRLACHNTSATYICNSSDENISVACRELAPLSDYISKQCCIGGFSRLDDFRQPNAGQLKLATVSGQWFQFLQGYGNCDHDASLIPIEYPLGGVNGECPVRKYSPGQPGQPI